MKMLAGLFYVYVTYSYCPAVVNVFGISNLLLIVAKIKIFC